MRPILIAHPFSLPPRPLPRLAPPAEVIDALLRLAEAPEPTAALRPSVAIILEVVAETYGLSVVELRSVRRARHITGPRQEAMWLARELTERSTAEIGRAIGKRDHTTILHGIAAVAARREADAELARRLDAMGARAVARAAGRVFG